MRRKTISAARMAGTRAMTRREGPRLAGLT
jgi:hypothetical protein